MTTPKQMNDFYVAIQGVMSEAHDSGLDIETVHEWATDASDEWLGEMEPDDPFDDDYRKVIGS